VTSGKKIQFVNKTQLWAAILISCEYPINR